MSGRRLAAITRRLLRQFRRDRRTIALLFVAPLVILSLVNFLLRGGGDRPTLAVVDQDHGPLASAIATNLERSSSVTMTSLDLNAATGRLRDGTLTGYVLLAPALSTGSTATHVVAPELHLEGSQPGPAQTVTQALQQAAAAAMSSQQPPGAPTPARLQIRVSYLYGGPGLDTLDYFGSAYIGLVVFFLVFVITSVSFLRERSQGTLERLMASPVRRGEIVLGYMLGFGALALLQSAEVLVFCLYVLKIHNSGNALLIFLIEMLVAVAAVNLGIFLSVFARTEFQAVQFIPLVVAPQFLLSGVILPVSTEPGWLQAVSNVLPLTYAVNGLRDVMVKGADLSWASVRLDTGVIAGFCVVVVVAASATLRRRLD